MVSTQNVVQGIAIKYKDQPWLVTRTEFTKPGKGAAFTTAWMKNLKTGNSLQVNFKSGESVEILDTQRTKCQFLYADGETHHFMDNESYEQFELQLSAIGDNKKYLIDGTECYALHIDGTPVSIQVPPKMEFKITETTPGEKGDTATGGKKDATIETGAVIKVPLFIKEGETVIVNTELGEYVSKA
jgi:elongation factor P